MIDDKKIEATADKYAIDECGYLYYVDKSIAFKEGAKWAIKEFLKDLWHDGEEVPKEKNKSVLMWFESYSVGERELDNDEYYDLCNTGKDGYDEDTWKMICDEGGWCSKWLYLDDLQKGGKQ